MAFAHSNTPADTAGAPTVRVRRLGAPVGETLRIANYLEARRARLTASLLTGWSCPEVTNLRRRAMVTEGVTHVILPDTRPTSLKSGN